MEERDAQLKDQIVNVHRKHRAYGYRRVALELDINHKRVRRVMKKYGLKPPRRRTKKWCTRSTSHHTYTNLIKDLVPTKAHEVWCSDLSFIKFRGSFWYLATVEDVVTRQVMGARVGKHHDQELVLVMLKQACSVAIPNIFHSDQGTEFMAKACTTYLEQRGVRISVSDTGSPWQNGYAESFFGRFKDEFGDFGRFETAGELIEEIYSQIRYYNQDRIHTALKMPPSVFAQKS